MKIIILEGIATSGKSSLVERISALLGKDKLVVLGEPDTHIPIMKKTDELHIDFFKSLITNAINQDANLVIFDRLHFTQAYRANADISRYDEVEDLLARQKNLSCISGS